MVGQIIENGTGAIELNRKAAWNEEGFIILCVIPKKGEFVIWYQGPDGPTVSGRYFQTLPDAFSHFTNRV